MTARYNIFARNLVLLAGFLLALCAFFASTLSVYADTRASVRDRGETGRTTEPIPAPSPSPTPAQSPPSGGSISSATGGTANSGGNSGGVVITGDEHVEVFEVNVGPTNSPPKNLGDEGDGPAPAPEPGPQCGSDRRPASGCPVQNLRTR